MFLRSTDLYTRILGMDSPYLTPEQAASYLGVKSLQTLRKLPIPTMRIRSLVRYERSDIDAYMQSIKRGPAILSPRFVRKYQHARRGKGDEDLGVLAGV